MKGREVERREGEGVMGLGRRVMGWFKDPLKDGQVMHSKSSSNGHLSSPPPTKYLKSGAPVPKKTSQMFINISTVGVCFRDMSLLQETPTILSQSFSI